MLKLLVILFIIKFHAHINIYKLKNFMASKENSILGPFYIFFAYFRTNENSFRKLASVICFLFHFFAVQNLR